MTQGGGVLALGTPPINRRPPKKFSGGIFFLSAFGGGTRYFTKNWFVAGFSFQERDKQKRINYLVSLPKVLRKTLERGINMRELRQMAILTILLLSLLLNIPVQIQDSAMAKEEFLTSSTMVINEDVVVEPMTERELINLYVEEISYIYSIDGALIHSVIWHESRYNTKSVNKSKTCFGLMQVCPKWHSERATRLGVIDYLDPRGSILLGVDYIAELLVKYKDISLVLMLYNMSHKKAFDLYRKGELSNYAKSVLKRAEEIKQGVK